MTARRWSFSLREYLFAIIGTIVVSLGIISPVWPWTRQVRTLLSIALSARIGIIVWNTTLNVTNAPSLNVDGPTIGLSVQDVGSGVFAFLFTVLARRFVTAKTEGEAEVAA